MTTNLDHGAYPDDLQELLLQASREAKKGHTPEFAQMIDAIRQFRVGNLDIEGAFLFLMTRCSSSGHVDAVRELLRHCDARSEPSNGEGSFLHIAAEWDRVDLVRLLLPLSDIHRLNGSGRTPLQQAAEYRSLNCARLLLIVDGPDRCNGLDLVLADAQGTEDWQLVDWLAPFCAPVNAQAAWERGGPERMPVWHANLERLALAQTLLPGVPSGPSQETSSTTNDETIPSVVVSRKTLRL